MDKHGNEIYVSSRRVESRTLLGSGSKSFTGIFCGRCAGVPPGFPQVDIRLQAVWLADRLHLDSLGSALLFTLPRHQPMAEQRHGTWQTVANAGLL